MKWHSIFTLISKSLEVEELWWKSEILTFWLSHTIWRWVGHLFTYEKTWERGRVNDFDLNNGRVYTYIRRSVVTRIFPRGPWRLRYNESQCSSMHCTQGKIQSCVLKIKMIKTGANWYKSNFSQNYGIKWNNECHKLF